MGVLRTSSVTRIADWRYAGISYYVHVGQVARMAGYLTVLAIGPAAAYRSVVLRPSAASQALDYIFAAPDLETRSGTVECLLALGGGQPH